MSIASEPRIGTVMGNNSDWGTTRHALELLREFGMAFKTVVVSTHGTPAWPTESAQSVESLGLEAIIAWAFAAAY